MKKYGVEGHRGVFKGRGFEPQWTVKTEDDGNVKDGGSESIAGACLPNVSRASRQGRNRFKKNTMRR